MAKPPVDSGMRLAWRQMGAILKKNALLKAADWRQTLAEITIPALFMLLLVWIKTTTNVFDSPAASYSCGQTIPWRYEKHVDPTTIEDSPLYQCLQKPDNCKAENYYRDEDGVFEDMGLQDLYPTVGFMDSGIGYPWYGLTIGDDSKVYADFGRLTGVNAYNPSQDLRTLVSRLYLYGEKTIIAVAPASEQQDQQQDRQQQQVLASEREEGGSGDRTRHSGSSDWNIGIGNGRAEVSYATVGSGSETAAAEEFSAWLVEQLGGSESTFADAVRVFSSEQAVVDYVESDDYDTPSGSPFSTPLSPSEEGREDVHFDRNLRQRKGSMEVEGGQPQGSSQGSPTRQERRSKVGMAVIFNKAPLEGEVPQWDYTLRLNYTYGVSQFEQQATCLYPGCSLKYKLPSTLVTTSALERPPTSNHLWGYSYSGFLSLQKSVDEFILSKAAGDRMYLNVSMGFFPEQAFRTDEFQQIITSTLGIFYMLAFLYPVSRAVRVLVSEKEGRMKEALRMMGLPDLIYHGSWFITFQAQWVVTNLLILLVVWNSVFRYSDHWLVWVWLEAVALAVMAFCFLISTFFSRSKTAATLGSIIFFAAFFPYYFVGSNAVTDVPTKTWASLLVPTCMALGTDTFAAFEGGLVGVQRSNIRQSYEDRLPYVNMVTMLFIDAALYFVLAWYLDKVIPSEFGTPLPWHFPVSAPIEARRRAKRAMQQRQEVHSAINAQAARALARRARQLKEWKRQGAASDGSVNGGAGAGAGAEDLAMPLLPASSQRMASREWVASSGLEGVHTYDEEGGAKVEPVGPQLSQQVVEGRTVSTRGLGKVYANGKAAVKRLNLDLFEGHISVLLGHNGAGKSTAISMITGTLPPTTGQAYLRGRKLSSDLTEVRRSLGVCFQQNTLFDQLTVLQHLRLFAVVKGVKAKDVDDEAARMVAEVGLVEKRDTPTSALSGGQKRKLSVALAFIGGSEVVVLDEPTSGMDPFSRRSTWSVLQRQRKGRVILLTTHFMDEADTLGDRIAIMAEGELRCMGSSMFLKGLYGVGYTLTVMKTDQSDGVGNGSNSSIDPWERRASTSSGSLMMRAEMQDGHDSLLALILDFVPEALTVSKVGKERNYRLPFASASKFVEMFREIDRRKAELAVAGYGVSVTTLEEVFLRVGHGSEDPFPSGDPANSSSMHGTIPRTRLPSVELSSSPGPRGRAGSAHSSYYSFSSEHGGGRGKGGVGASVGLAAGGAIGAGVQESKENEKEVVEEADMKGGGGSEGGRGLAEEDNEPMIIGGESIHTELGWPPPSLAFSKKSVEGSTAGEVDLYVDLDRASRGMFWVHLKALLAKRATYGLRDKKSQFFQLIVPTLLFLLGLILLRLSRNVFDQPSLLLSPGTHFNPGKPASLRNPVPLDAPRDEPESLASAVADRFDGVSVDGKSIIIPAGGAEDNFKGCAQGASALVNMSEFLLDAAGPGEQGASRYGAVVLDGSSRLPNSSRVLLPSDWERAEAEGEGVNVGYWAGSLAYGVLINASAVHGAPIFMNLVNSAALQAIFASKSSGEGLGLESRSGLEERERSLPSISIRSSPLPRTKGEEQARQTIDGFTTAIMVVISMCFLPASYAIFVVKERAVKAKHQQIISGVGVLSYWASTFTFDVASYAIPFVVFLGLLYAFDVESYTTSEAAGATTLLFLFYGPAVAPFTYCISFLFKSASSAQTMVLFVNFVTGLALMVVSFVLNLVESTRDYNAKLKWVYRLFPGFCLGDGLAQLVLCEDGKTCMDISNMGRGPPEKLTPLSWAITGADIASLVFTCIAYLVICLLVECGTTSPKLLALFSPDPSTDQDSGGESGQEEEEEDEDVAAEARRVERMGMGGTLGDMEGGGQVILNNLRKVYRTKQGPKVAVQGLSFSVSRGDCFGFLGINGAGKSTTLGILSGDICPTGGQASIAGHDILTEQSKLRRYIGYCPQDDALLDLLTVEEHLLLYARIKGVKETRLRDVADKKMKEMDLKPFRSVKACELSGGNKRKLSVAIAMIGNPRVVFLDEPSTGMDPIARRFMWDIISRMTTTDRECSVILTTHSMEEAESLCNNIGIMVNGRLRCLGSTQHLKHRFGRGFEADIKMHPPSNAEAAEVMQRIVKEDVDNLVGDELNSSRLRPPLDNCCRRLETGDNDSDSHRVGALEAALKDGSGAFLFDVLGSEGGTLPTRLFIDWYLCEERINDLKAFLEETFPGAELVERPTLYSCRYKIPHQGGMNLADVFGHFEAAKAKLGLASYAVGQTTLEQIFNGFAASKDNPEVMLRQGQATELEE